MPGVTTPNQVAFDDLSKADKVLDQRGTPFWSRLKEGEKPKALVYFQAVGKMGKRRRQGKPERQDIKGFEGDEGKQIGGRVEYFHRDPAVSTEAEVFKANQATMDLDYDKQVTKKITEGRRDIDFKVLGDQESQEDDGVTGYFFRGAGRLINDGTTGVATSQGGDSPTSYTGGVADLAFNDAPTAIPAAYRTPTAQIYAGTSANLTEDTVLDMMQARAYRTGISLEFTLWVAYALKRLVSTNFGRYVAAKAGFDTIVTTSRRDIDRGRLVLKGPDVFEGDFGIVTVEVEPWMPTNLRGYGMDMAQCEKKTVFAARHREFENKGGGRRGLIEWIVGPWFGDPRAHFKICPSDEVAAQVDFEA